jgi:uncharacterized RDD family membrane protein YckC
VEEHQDIHKFHTTEEDYSHYPPAGLFIRLFSTFLDGIIMGIVNQMITALTLVVAFGLDTSIKDFSKLPPSWQLMPVLLSFFALYFILLRPIKKKGQTPGKKIFKLKILSEDFSTDISWVQILVREFLSKFLTALLFIITIPMFLLSKDKRALHDFICSTRVIRIKEND